MPSFCPFHLRILACGLTVTVAAGAAVAAATAPSPAFPNFDSPAALQAACDQGLADGARQLKALERAPADGRWLARYDAYNARLEDAISPTTFISAVHPDKAMRDAAEACELRWNDFNSTLGQNERLYKAARRVQPADPIDREMQRQVLEGFEDSGVSLPPAARARAKALADQIGELSQAFSRNIRDANIKLAFTEAELRGVPDAVWRNAPRDEQGRVVLGVDYPSYLPVLQSAEDADARQRMWRAKTDEGGAANLKLLAELVQLRKEYAVLFRVASHAEFKTRRRMAGSPARVTAFLGEVKTAVEARELRELEELRAAKAAHLGLPPADVRLARWDLAFYSERVRKERYAVDQEAFRAYFPPEESVRFALRTIEKMMGVRYRRIEGATLWHPEARTYEVSDAASGRPIATLLVDLYPREGKYNHAAVWPLRHGSTLTGRLPMSALVVNIDRKGLTLDELETLLHELGHAVHGNLSRTRYVEQSGTAVQRDFVEAPSQMLEDWVYDRRVLKVFAEVCPACKPVPDEAIAQAVKAKHYGTGIQASRQWLYASYDMALYGPNPQDPMALWRQMEAATPLGHVQGSMFPAGFDHVAGGYSAGYYGYLWSLVVATDLRTAFAADKLDPAVGRRYRDTVLAQGGQRPPRELVKDFLGREFNAKAFFDDLAQ